MMKRTCLLLILICSFCVARAQQDASGFSPEKFRQAEESYITKKAHLSQAEVAAFFPLFREYKRQQMAYYESIKSLYKKGKEKDVTDAEYRKIVENCASIEISISKHKLQYMKKFEKVLSGKHLYRAIEADNRFHRDMLKGFVQQKH